MRGQGRAKTFASINAIICYQCKKQGPYQLECPRLQKEANYAKSNEEGVAANDTC